MNGAAKLVQTAPLQSPGRGSGGDERDAPRVELGARYQLRAVVRLCAHDVL
jgi:hypothetical protein